MAVSNQSTQGKSITISGTTNSTADTAQVFIHNQKAIPKSWSALEGDVYVPANGRGMNSIDVRSHQTSMKFSILLTF